MRGRHALVIGAIAYPGQELDNAVTDAARVANALRARAFSVSTVLDPDLAAIDAALAAFGPVAQNAELAVIYLAGHAVERYGSGYFLPIDFNFPLTTAGLRYSATCLNAFVEATAGAASRIIVLDACRNWPLDLDEARRTSNDLDELIAAEREWPNLLLAYATSATTMAGDGAKGVGSTFSNSLCAHLLDHGLTVDECFRRVSQDVVAKRGNQQPWTYSSLARTLSFTDLPRYVATQRYAVPNPERLSLGTWTTPTFSDQGIIVGLGDTMAWRVDIGGFKRVNHRGHDRLVGAADCDLALVLAGSDGILYRAGAGQQLAVNLDADPSFGLKASPSAGGFTHYGAGVVTCLRLDNDTVEVIARHNVGFDVYCCTYMPDGLIWVAGDQGLIYELDPRDAGARLREITAVRHPVNAMTATPAGDRIFVVGQGGLAVQLDRSGTEIAKILPDRRFRTAAGIRAQLISNVEDEDIRAYIFEPSKMNAHILQNIDDMVGNPDYHDCALAPTLPILAVATQESTVILLDTRDLQVIQDLDVGSGNSTIAAGVHFLSDYELAVIDGRGEVTFFGA